MNKRIVDKIRAYLNAHDGRITQRDLMRGTKARLSEINQCIDAGIIGTEIVKQPGPGRRTTYVFIIGRNCVTDGVAEKARINRQIFLSAKPMVAAAIQARRDRARRFTKIEG